MAPKAASASTALLFMALLITYIPSSSASTCDANTVTAIATACLTLFTVQANPSSECCGAIASAANVGACVCDVIKYLNVTVDGIVVLSLLGKCNNSNIPSSYTCS